MKHDWGRTAPVPARAPQLAPVHRAVFIEKLPQSSLRGTLAHILLCELGSVAQAEAAGLSRGLLAGGRAQLEEDDGQETSR